MKYLTMLLVLFVGIACAQAEEGAREGKKGHHKGCGSRGCGGMREKMLEKYDADKDGKLSEEERAEMKEGFKSRWADKKKEWAKNHNADGDGGPSGEELGKSKEAFQAKMKQYVDAAFDKADADGSGQLSKEEVHALFMAMKKGAHGKGWRKGGCDKSACGKK
jgi:hypothetical protein